MLLRYKTPTMKPDDMLPVAELAGASLPGRVPAGRGGAAAAAAASERVCPLSDNMHTTPPGRRTDRHGLHGEWMID